jgi:signal transduction histidine kinase
MSAAPERPSGPLAEEQAALRRVATLVARGATPEELFAATVEEVGRILPVDLVSMSRYDPGGALTFLASWGKPVDFVPIGRRLKVGGDNLGTIVLATGRPARINNYVDASGAIGQAVREGGVCSAVGTPITVEGRLWGMMAAGTSGNEPLPADTEARLAAFTELLAMAIANAESRAEVARLAEEQAALRRVATLVARGSRPQAVFRSVVEEVGRLLPVVSAGLARYETDGALTFVASWGEEGGRAPVGTWLTLGGNNLGTIVFETGRPARVESYADASGPLGVAARKAGIRSSVGTPIIVEGRRWGLVVAGSSDEQPLPAHTGARLVSFTELVATAISNAESRAATAASLARIVAASDETRRRIERDLHDGIQQQLVSMMLELRAAQSTQCPQVEELMAQLARTAEGMGEILDEAREISRGIHPAVLSERGLGPAVKALARRSALPVELDLRVDRRLPRHVEAAAYYVVSEALANATKHANACALNVELDATDAVVRLTIRDDGMGGADFGRGSGLVGLSDRVEALGGTLQLSSPRGRGTTLRAELPLDRQNHDWIVRSTDSAFSEGEGMALRQLPPAA